MSQNCSKQPQIMKEHHPKQNNSIYLAQMTRSPAKISYFQKNTSFSPLSHSVIIAKKQPTSSMLSQSELSSMFVQTYITDPVDESDGQSECNEYCYRCDEESSLRERINQRLSQKTMIPKDLKVEKKYYPLNNIKQATFRPTAMKQLLNKTNQNSSRVLNKSKESGLSKRKQEFYQRQNQTLVNRINKASQIKEQNKTIELKECTFKPKLTKYNPSIYQKQKS